MIGRTLSHYEIVEEISRGGMGVVYRARDLNLGREVALKVLPEELVHDRLRGERMLQEARAAALIEHPHIAVIHEVGQSDGVTFIAMELIRGEKLSDVLARGPLQPKRALDLAVEITEGLLLEATDETRHQLNNLKNLGLTLAMDDFGTGYSSLSYLKKFPIDVIKIDRSFIKDIPDNQDDMEITSAVIAMAHNLKLKVVAEGIETAAQLGFLRRQQCDVGQGYLFDKPIPGRELIDSLRRYPCRPAPTSDQRT